VVALALAAVATGQEPEQDALAAIEARAAADPDGALEALDLVLAARDLPAAPRRKAELLRPRVLQRAGRADEARAAWEALLRRGEDVGAELLALSGARLAVELAAAPVPGEPLRLTCSGGRTGALAVRLYRVAGARLRVALEAEPARGLAQHLRAPPAAALSRLASWDAPEPTPEAPTTTRSPAPLEPGTYLLTVTARGVTLATPVVVSRALAVCRRAAGGGVLWLVDRARGDPIADLELRALDADGAPGDPLGRTSADGLLALTGASARAFGWLAEGAELVPFVVDLPEARAPVAAAPPVVSLDLPVYRPGGLIVARAAGLRPDSRAAARLLDPRGVAVHTAAAVVDGAGVAAVTLPLPRHASPGPWRVELGPARATARVLPGSTPGVEVALVLPEATSGRRLLGRVEARLATGGSLENRAVRWAVRLVEAEPGLEGPPAPSPLPPYALRARTADDAGQVIASGALTLGPRGEAPLDVPLPALARPTLLRVEAELLLAAHEPGAAPAPPAAVRFVAAGPRDLLLDVRPARFVAAPTETVVVSVRAARLDGQPAALEDLELTAELRPARGGAPVTERRALRTDADGHARTQWLFDAPGAVALRVAGHDATGRDVAAVSSFQVVARRAEEQGGAAAAIRLALEAAPAPGAREAHLLAELPFERGHALVTCEAEGALDARVVAVEGGRARLTVAAGDQEVVLVAVRGGVVHEARAGVAPEGAPLVVDAWTTTPADDGALPLSVRVSDVDGTRRLAAIAALLYPRDTARFVATGEPRGGAPGDALAPDEATRPRAHETTVAPAWPDLSSLGGRSAWTNGSGLGTLRLPAPAGPAWARVFARARRGTAGETWCAADLERGPLSVSLVSAAHAVEGDRGELVARIAVTDRAALPPGAALRVTWKAEGLELKAPRVEGSRPVLLGDPGPAALRLEPTPELRVVFSTVATGGPLGPGPTTARAEVTVEAEGSPIVARATWTLPVRARGLVESLSFAGEVPVEGEVAHTLELPPQAIVGAARLEVSLDPEPATAALAGAAALARSADPLLGPLHALLAQRRVAALLIARRLAPPARPDADGGPGAVELTHALGALAATRDATGAWGGRTPSVARLLVDLRAEGVDVPAALVGPALDALASWPPGASGRGRALLALALAGRLTDELVATIDAPSSAPDERPALARALVLAGAERRAEEALAAAVVGARSLTTTEARAELLALLLERDASPALQAELLAAVLQARAGAGWSDADDAGAAVRALALVAAREADAPGTQVELVLEGRDALSTWSGAGLAEWTGPAALAGSQVARRSRLQLRARGPRPAAFSGRVDALVRDVGPPVARGLSLTRTLAVASSAGRQPVGVAGVAAGDVVHLRVELAPSSEGAPLRTDDLLLEVPLPGGCRVAALPAGALLVDGVLSIVPLGGRVEVTLVALIPGDHRLLRARARSLRDADRVATSDEVLLRIR
jgi:hypothetical protein